MRNKKLKMRPVKDEGFKFYQYLDSEPKQQRLIIPKVLISAAINRIRTHYKP